MKFQVSESDIQSLFFPYGKVRSVRLFRDKGFGFVEFTEPTVVDYILREKVSSFCLTLNTVTLTLNSHFDLDQLTLIFNTDHISIDPQVKNKNFQSKIMTLKQF